jgi:hypothetical protein
LYGTGTPDLPENIYKDIEFEYEMDKNFCRVNRIPETIVTMGSQNQSYSIIRKADERKIIKSEY